MSPEAQRIAIAEACKKLMCPEYGWPQQPHDLPDYLTDLNAMHEAEKALTSVQYWQYVEWCEKLVKLNHVDYVAHSTSATAAQRAEAFLRALNLWDDSK